MGAIAKHLLEMSALLGTDLSNWDDDFATMAL
jgi:hypothetical protein